jgi:hypothetical protein
MRGVVQRIVQMRYLSPHQEHAEQPESRRRGGLRLHQYYTNPRERRRTTTRHPRGEYRGFQGFPNGGERRRNCSFAFTRQRPLVRNQHRPLLRVLHNKENLGPSEPYVKSLVQQTCSNMKWFSRLDSNVSHDSTAWSSGRRWASGIALIGPQNLEFR